MSEDEWLSTTHAAALLGCHPHTLKKWADRGLIRYRKVGRMGHRRWLRSELDRFIRSVDSASAIDEYPEGTVTIEPPPKGARVTFAYTYWRGRPDND